MSETSGDPMQRVDPELRAPLEFYLGLPEPPQDIVGLAGFLRARGQMLAKPFLDSPVVEERRVPNPESGLDVTVYVINANPSANRGAIVHFHGGGFIAGSARASVADLQIQAKALDCVIITVEYRLAPETPFPGALQDNYAALKWTYENAALLGIDNQRIALQGESAGGGHAAALALAVGDRNDIPLCFLALICPMLDDRTGDTRDPPSHTGTFLWTRSMNRLGWAALLGAGPSHPPGAVPARAENLSRLPPTFLSVGDLDLFFDEVLEFSERLTADGIPTELIVLPGAVHLFQLLAPHAAVTRRHQSALEAALGRVVG